MSRSPSDTNAENVDFLFSPLSLNWIDFSSLYVKDTLVHIECEAVFRPRMPIFSLGK